MKSTLAASSFTLSALAGAAHAAGLPCLNHACDDSVDAMTDLFAEGRSHR
jgi:hypothetical protein